MEKSQENYQAHFAISAGTNVSVFASSLDDLVAAVRKIQGTPAAPVVINAADNPATGAPLVPPPPPGQIEQAAAAASFGQGAPMTPEQMIAANAAGQMPVPVLSAAPPVPAPTISPAAAIPGGAAAQVTPPPPAPSGDVDSRGVRWDPRIHSSTRTRIANGEWRTKKGVPDGLKEQVEAEQRALAAIPPAPASPFVADDGNRPALATPAVPPVPPAPAAVVATPPAPPVPTPPAPVANGPTTFNDLCNWLNGPMLANPPKLTLDEVNAEVKRHGFDNLSALLTRDDYVPIVHAALAALVATR